MSSPFPLEQQTRKTLFSLGIRPEDVEESFLRSRGPGGQHANKNATCVRLRHRSSGIEVRCEDQRSQSQNRRQAWAALAAKLKEHVAAMRLRQQKQLYRERARKRRRSPAAKEEMLLGKRLRAQKKIRRRSVRDLFE